MILILLTLLSGACSSPVTRFTMENTVEQMGTGYIVGLKSAKLCDVFLRDEARESTQNICLCVAQHRKERNSRDNCYHDQNGKYLKKSCKIGCISNPGYPYYGVFVQQPDSGLHHIPKLTLLVVSQLITNPLARSMLLLFNIIHNARAQEAQHLEIENWLTPFDRFTAAELSKEIDLRNMKEMLTDVLTIVYADLSSHLDQSRIHKEVQNNNLSLHEHNSLLENVNKMIEKQQELIAILDSYAQAHNLTLLTQAKQIEFHAARVTNLTKQTQNISNNVNEYLMEAGIPGDLLSILAGASFLIISVIATCLLAHSTILKARETYMFIHFYK